MLHGHAGICRILLESGGDAFACDDEGNDALATAIRENRVAIADLLRRERERATDTRTLDMATHGPVPAAPSAEDLFDLSTWESLDEASPPPIGDAVVVANSVLLQQKISTHGVVDTDEDWSDVEILLPRLRQRSSLSSTMRAAMEQLLVEGVEAGWLLREQFVNIFRQEEEDLPGSDLNRILALVAESLGILVETDYFPSAGSRALQTALQHYEEEVEGLAFLDDLLGPPPEPLYQYLADIRSSQLLSPEEEQALGTQIEEAMASALAAITASDGTRGELLRLLRQSSSDENVARLIAERGAMIVAGDEQQNQGMTPVPSAATIHAERTDTVGCLLKGLQEEQVDTDADFASRSHTRQNRDSISGIESSKIQKNEMSAIAGTWRRQVGVLPLYGSAN